MTTDSEKSHKPNGLTIQILVAMALAVVAGMVLYWLTPPTTSGGEQHLYLPAHIHAFIIDDLLQTGGDIFMTILRMLVVPVVFVSLVAGSSSIAASKLGKVGLKTFILYMATSVVAITLGLVIASLFGLGKGVHAVTSSVFTAPPAPSLKSVILDMFPSNPLRALAEGKMLQIIVFSLLLGTSLKAAGAPGKRVSEIFTDLNHVIMRLIITVMKVAPYGVFMLVTHLFAKMGFGLAGDLVIYFFSMILILLTHLVITYSLLLTFVARLNPIPFFRKMYPAQLFAFSVSSSNSSIPVVLETMEQKMGVKNSIAAFVIPLGATINMDGTAIMQGVATVFIANAYGFHLGITGFLVVIGMSTLASIGTAGVPSMGLITLAMVLKQVGLPVEGIGMIIGVDRLLDMIRTAVNITGDSVVTVVVAKSEKSLDTDIYNDPER